MGPVLNRITTRRWQEFLKKQILDPKANNPASLIPNLGFSDADAKAIWASLETLNGLDDA